MASGLDARRRPPAGVLGDLLRLAGGGPCGARLRRGNRCDLRCGRRCPRIGADLADPAHDRDPRRPGHGRVGGARHTRCLFVVCRALPRPQPRPSPGDRPVRPAHRGRRRRLGRRARAVRSPRLPRLGGVVAGDHPCACVLQLRRGRAHRRRVVGTSRSAGGAGGADPGGEPGARLSDGHAARAHAGDRFRRRPRLPLLCLGVRDHHGHGRRALQHRRDRNLVSDNATPRPSGRRGPVHHATRRRHAGLARHVVDQFPQRARVAAAWRCQWRAPLGVAPRRPRDRGDRDGWPGESGEL